jgi:hypothetical protein
MMNSDAKHAQNDDEFLDGDDGRIMSIDADGDEDPEADSKSSSQRQSSSSRHRGVGLDLGFCVDNKPGEKKPSAQEDSILVIFELPDGSQGEARFKLGQTVEVLKSYVDTEYRIPMMDQRLFLEDRLMMDPLSLCDFAEAKGTIIC